MEFKINPLSEVSVEIAIAGGINEDSEVTLQELIGHIAKFQEVHVNFERITTINSLGVRAWINFIRSASTGHKIFFHNCTPEVISQINMIPSFAGPAQIESFQVNYVCMSCEHEESRLIHAKELKPGQLPQANRCSQCGEMMETEELEDEYFSFLTRQEAG